MPKIYRDCEIFETTTPEEAISQFSHIGECVLASDEWFDVKRISYHFLWKCELKLDYIDDLDEFKVEITHFPHNIKFEKIKYRHVKKMYHSGISFMSSTFFSLPHKNITSTYSPERYFQFFHLRPMRYVCVIRDKTIFVEWWIKTPTDESDFM